MDEPENPDLSRGPFLFQHDGVEWRVAIGEMLTGRQSPPSSRSLMKSYRQQEETDGAIPFAIEDRGGYYAVWFHEAEGRISKFDDPFMMGKTTTRLANPDV